MAERIIRQLFDDLDDSEIADGKGGSVEFALRGTTYRIDLSASNTAKLEKALAPFVGAATQVSGSRTARPSVASDRGTRPGRRPAKGKVAVAKPTAAVRAWAADNGHAVSARGRVPAAILDEYERVHAAAN